MELMYHSTARARHTLGLACGVFLGAGIVLASVGPTLPLLALHIGHDVAALGGLFTAISAGVVLAQFGVGPASDRFGQRLVLVAGMLLMGGGAIGVTLGRSLITLLAYALLAGIGFGGVLTAGNLLVARLFPTRSAAALNGVNLFFGIGSILGPSAVSLVGARLDTPQLALWMGAGLLFALAPVVLNYAAASPAVHTASVEPESGAARPAGLWLLGVLLLLYTGIEVGFGGWVAVYLMTGAHLTPAAAALGAAGFWLALTAGRALGVVLGLRLAPLALLSGSLIGLLAGALLLSSGVGAGTGAIASILLLGVSCGPVFPTVMAVVTTATRGSSVMASRVLALGNGGGLIIPALLGLLLRQYGPPAMAGMVLTVALAMLTLCAAVILVNATVSRVRRRQETLL